MIRAPSPEEENRRSPTRERGTLAQGRIQHTNRIRGLLSGQGIRDYDPLRRDRFKAPRIPTSSGRDVLRTTMLTLGLDQKMLAGHKRYAHIAAALRLAQKRS